MSTPQAPPERLRAGTVGKAHGLDGSFYVVEPDLRLLAKGKTVWVAGEADPREVQRMAGTDAKPIVRLEGAATRTEAEALRGRVLEVAGSEAPALGDDEYWAQDLSGCVVVGQDGAPLGTVEDLLGLPSCEALVVRGGRHGELLIPMVKDAIKQIDLPGKQITVDAEFLALED